MNARERILTVVLASACLLLAFRAGAPSAVASSLPAAATGADAPQPARIAVCDVLALTESLFAADPYLPARKSEEERLRARLTPLETELELLSSELRGADPQAQASQDKAREFESKRDQYARIRQESSEAYDKMVTSQFSEAYERVTAAAGAVARGSGYTHVIAHKMGKLTGPDPQRLIADLLARPVVVRPDGPAGGGGGGGGGGCDITEQVRSQLEIGAEK